MPSHDGSELRAAGFPHQRSVVRWVGGLRVTRGSLAFGVRPTRQLRSLAMRVIQGRRSATEGERGRMSLQAHDAGPGGDPTLSPPDRASKDGA